MIPESTLPNGWFCGFLFPNHFLSWIVKKVPIQISRSQDPDLTDRPPGNWVLSQVEYAISSKPQVRGENTDNQRVWKTSSNLMNSRGHLWRLVASKNYWQSWMLKIIEKPARCWPSIISQYPWRFVNSDSLAPLYIKVGYLEQMTCIFSGKLTCHWLKIRNYILKIGETFQLAMFVYVSMFTKKKKHSSIVTMQKCRPFTLDIQETWIYPEVKNLRMVYCLRGNGCFPPQDVLLNLRLGR